MKREVLYQFQALYRGDFRVTGFRFGEGEKTVAVVGSTRGNENQQIYCCAQLVKNLKKLEEQGRITEGKEILVIPCANTYSVNTGKRFWGIDNTDINRMFPGYDQGETTQRIADGIFKAVKDYQIGIQLSSFYMRGGFVPHVRMMQTGFEKVDKAKEFGLPYVSVRSPRPFDTTTLNYNWQIWETDAFSIYSTHTEKVDKRSARMTVDAILNFLAKQGVISYHAAGGYNSEVVSDDDLVTVRATAAGFVDMYVEVGQRVAKGKTLARIVDLYDGSTLAKIKAPCDGTVFFACDDSLTYANTALFKLVRREVLIDQEES